MGKKKAMTIKVTYSCHEDWDKMSASEQGKHCSSCNKNVIDFTNYTDKELVDFFKNLNGTVCGRIENYQLNRPIMLHEPGNGSFLYKALFGTAIAASLAANGQAQESQPGNVTASAADHRTSFNIKKKETTIGTCIKGKIVDKKDGSAFGQGVTISLVGTSISCGTDGAGLFSLKIPENLKGKRIVIQADCNGYKSKKVTLRGNDYLAFQRIALKVIPYRGRVNVTMGQMTKFL